MSPDDSAPDADETAPRTSAGGPSFTTRTFLSPEGEPGDGAAGMAPASQPAFGTGDIDDEALDAIVRDVSPAPAAFVWAADDLAASDRPAGGQGFIQAELDAFAAAEADPFLSTAPDASATPTASPASDSAESGAPGDPFGQPAEGASDSAGDESDPDTSAPTPSAQGESDPAEPSDPFAEAAGAAGGEDSQPEAASAKTAGGAEGEDDSAETLAAERAADSAGDSGAQPETGPAAAASGAEGDGPDAETPAAEVDGTESESTERGAQDDDGQAAHGGLAAALAAAGAGVLAALAEVVNPDPAPGHRPAAEPTADQPADDQQDDEEPTDEEPTGADAPADDAPDTQDTPDPEMTTPSPDDATTTQNETAGGAPAGDGANADLADVPEGAQDATADVDQAFEAATDAGKADAPGPDHAEGDLDVPTLGPDDVDADTLRAALRTMMTSRKLDEKMLTLLKQGKGFFHIGSAGHEASQIAIASQFEGGKDWFCFYYRDLGTALEVGVTPAEVLRAHFGKASDPFGGGRQMPEHFGHRALNILSTSSSVGAQYVPAVGFGLAIERDRQRDGETGPTTAVYTSGGEGSTSQGAFHEALNWAARATLPVLFHIQDNGYAISVPVSEQTAGGTIWDLLGGYAGLRRIRYDGTDYFQSLAAARAAMEHIRAGKGPVALHADVVRLFPHSSSDDHRKYREMASIEADAARDPIPQFVRQLVEAGVVTADEVEAMRAEISTQIDRLAREIEAEADPDPATALDHVYFEGDDTREYNAAGDAGELIVMVDAINHALDEEMARDPKVLVYGEDVGGGKGGVFTATRGLTEKHGRDRCFNSPLAEHSVIGSAVGLACAGYKPVVEIQFADYIWPGMQPLRNQVASMRYRSNGEWANPMVIRVPTGGYIHGGLCHSQNVEAMFGHFPGLHVVMPSNAADAKGLLKAAIRGQDPVIFLEHKALYRQGPARRPEPHADYLVPLGKAAVTREGSDLTIVTWGAIVYKALNVAKTLEKEGVSVEVVDVRSFLPYDAETVLASARKTGRVLVAYEDHEFMGFGAEVAAQIADAAFHQLDAPVKRVAGAFTSIPYADALERAVLPQDDDVLAAAREVLAY